MQKLAKARKRKREETGRCEGRLPYGHKNEQEDYIRQMMFRLHTTNGRGYGQIAAHLNKSGFSNRSGNLWTRSNVRSILNSRLPARHPKQNCGLLEDGKIRLRNI